MRTVRIDRVRAKAGDALLRRVAGPEAHRKRARIHGTPGPRWFAPDRPVRVVHGDASMYVGGLAALLLQSLHPVAMAAVWAHSGFRGDPWGRLQRTSTFLAETTFGTAGDAERAVRRVRAVHARVTGTTTDGTAYRASDPALLSWVHLAETCCFLRAYQCYGKGPLPAARRDGYVADMASVARRLGVPDPPVTEAALGEALERRRGELRTTDEAAGTARYLLAAPPLPWPARLPYALLAAAAVDLLPPWARRLVVLPVHIRLLLPVARPGGRLVVAAIRWATPAPPVATRRPTAAEGGRRPADPPGR
ncbi:oxygenase MpaB family protein [Streptomyces sp. NPDC004435]|uniref:oxygenase MpaB family protein n=1 Tax=Streptomyces sp. NPDC004435 TaxID=3364701 RepID=UPI00369C714D